MPPPLLIYFHGLFGDLSESNALHAHAHSHGYIVAAPRGLDDNGTRMPTWHAVGNAGSTHVSTCEAQPGTPSNKKNCAASCDRAFGCTHPYAACWWATCMDSLGQVAELLDVLEAAVCFDTASVFGAGFSNGAMMLMEIAASTLASRFAGVVGFHGLPFRGNMRRPRARVPLLGVWGFKDTLQPPASSVTTVSHFGKNVTPMPLVRAHTGSSVTRQPHASGRAAN
jgi:poly(3-hydroxybutyrate) depolymerase